MTEYGTIEIVTSSGAPLVGADGDTLILAASTPIPSRSPATRVRLEQFRFQLVDEAGGEISYLHPNPGGQITAKSLALIARTLTGLVVAPGKHGDIDPMRPPRIRISAVFDGDEEDLGTFHLSKIVEHDRADGVYLEIHGYDRCALLLQCLRVALNVTKDTKATVGLEQALITAGLYDFHIDASNVVTRRHLAWAPGFRFIEPFDLLAESDPVPAPVSDLCRLAGFATPFVDRHDVGWVKRLPYLGAENPAVEWAPGEATTLRGGTTHTTDLGATVPTRWRVLSMVSDAVIDGVFELADSHPQSADARGLTTGYERTLTIPGLTSSALCRARARDEAQRNPAVHETRRIQAATDPTLEVNTVGRYKRRDWLIAGFTVPLAVGAPQDIDLRDSIVSEEAQAA